MNRERGFALLAALGLLVLLSTVGLEFSLRARARRLAAANALEGQRAQAAADAGVAHAHALLADLLTGARPMDPWAAYDLVLRDTTPLANARYAVALEDAAAKLHLNRATDEELRRLFEALRVDFGRADRLAQAILDWRDADDLHRARGAERDAYQHQDAPVLPANAPFDDVAELQHIMGMTPELYARVRPHLTVLGTGQVNLNTAGRPVLLALPGITETAVAALFRRRSAGRPVRSLEELSLELAPGPREVFQAATARLLSRAAFETRELIATSDGWLEGSPVRARTRALFARGGDHAFLTWRSAR